MNMRLYIGALFHLLFNGSTLELELSMVRFGIYFTEIWLQKVKFEPKLI